MKEFIKNMKISYILAAILYIALGVIFLIWPTEVGSILCVSFGLVLLAYGLITIISFFVHDSRLGTFRFELVLGIVVTAVGILFLLRPTFILDLFPVVLGIYIIIDALLNLKRAMELRSMNYTRWWVILALSAVSLILGVLILLRPGFLADMLFMLIGIVFIYNGLSDLWALFKLSRVTKEFRRQNPIVIDPIDIE